MKSSCSIFREYLFTLHDNQTSHVTLVKGQPSYILLSSQVYWLCEAKRSDADWR